MKAGRISRKRTTQSLTSTVKLQSPGRHLPGAEIGIVALAAAETAVIVDLVVAAEAADAVVVDAAREAVVAAAGMVVATAVTVVPDTKKGCGSSRGL